MAIPLELGVTFTPTEEADMKAAAQLITSIIMSKVNFNMSNEERETLSKMGDNRIAFVAKSVNDFGVTYPNLNGQSYPLALATSDLGTYIVMEEVLTLVKEATERAEELQMVAGHFAYKFMRNQYRNAEAYRTENVQGAQVVYDGLKACFEGQGPQNPSSQPPAGGNP